jgi:hypothetical protein
VPVAELSVVGRVERAGLAAECGIVERARLELVRKSEQAFSLNVRDRPSRGTEALMPKRCG